MEFVNRPNLNSFDKFIGYLILSSFCEELSFKSCQYNICIIASTFLWGIVCFRSSMLSLISYVYLEVLDKLASCLADYASLKKEYLYCLYRVNYH